MGDVKVFGLLMPRCSERVNGKKKSFLRVPKALHREKSGSIENVLCSDAYLPLVVAVVAVAVVAVAAVAVVAAAVVVVVVASRSWCGLLKDGRFLGRKPSTQAMSLGAQTLNPKPWIVLDEILPISQKVWLL